MGYYTRFELNVTGPAPFLEEFVADAESGGKYGEYGSELMDWVEGEAFGGDSGKWYGCEKDVTELSSMYPFLLFAIKGEGEEAGDIWKAWARNGRFVRIHARIVFDEPNLDELPTPDIEKAMAEKIEARRQQIDAEIALLEKLKSELNV